MRNELIIIICDFCGLSFPWTGRYKAGWGLLEAYEAYPRRSPTEPRYPKYEICPKCMAEVLSLRVADA